MASSQEGDKGPENVTPRPIPVARRSLIKKPKGEKHLRQQKNIDNNTETETKIISSKPHEQLSTETPIHSRRHVAEETKLMNSKTAQGPPTNRSKGSVAKLVSAIESVNTDDSAVQMRSRENTREQYRLHSYLYDRNRKARSHADENLVPEETLDQSESMLSESNTSPQTPSTDANKPIVSGIPDIEKEKDTKHENTFSDIDFSKGCDFCGKPDEDSSDAAFCKECKQICCLNCLAIHKKCNSTKGHELINNHAILNQDEDTSSVEQMSDEYKSLWETQLSDTKPLTTDTDYKTQIHFCEYCDNYTECNYINEANVLCDQCDKKLCDQCLEIHHTDKLKKEHKITPLREHQDKFLRKLKCNSHSDTSITYFCQFHREIICIHCKTGGKHDDCMDFITNIDGIYNAASGMKIDKTITRQKVKEMTCLFDELSRLECIVTVNLEDLSYGREVLSKKLKNKQDYTKRYFDSGLKRANDKIITILSKEEELIKEKEKESKKFLSVFEKQIEQFTKLLESGSKEEIFIMQTALQSDIQKYEQLFEELQEPINKTFTITDMPNVDALLKEVQLTKTVIATENIVAEKPVFDDQQAVCIGEVDVSDLNVSEIVGMAILRSGEILLCDKTTNMLIILCKKYTVVGKFKLNGPPSSMTVINNKNIVVSLPGKNCLQQIEIGDKLSMSEGPTKETIVPCLLISQYDTDLIAIVDDALCKCIVKMDTNGNITSPNPVYADTKNTLNNILFMAVCPVNKMLYITEKTHGCMGISLEEGVTVFHYEGNQHSCHAGLSTHPTGNIFIAEKNADKVVVVHLADDKNADKTKKLKDIISVEGLQPLCIAYSYYHHTFLVHSQSSRNFVRVFKLI